MTYLVVADWDNVTKKVTAEARAIDQADADTKKAIMVSEGYTNAFNIPLPDGPPKYFVVDPVAETVSVDQDQADADALADSWEKLRAERNTLLTESDWTQYNDSPLTDEVKAEWAVHREELRDLPANTDDPTDPTWPEAPE